MTKQNFISMSLDSGLKVGQHRCGKIEPYLIYGIKQVKCVDKISCYIDDSAHGDYQNSWIDGVFPILYPLSDLTKEIEHGGEKFVPIVELAKIAWVDGYVDFKYQSLKEGTVFIAFSDKNNVFGYDSNTQSFFGAIDGKPCSVVNQLTLFETMVKYHFDIYNLISKNQAIDINTLERNPYK
jgi:hypothetical protein